MNIEQFYKLAEQAGFCFWGSEEWKPDGAVIDWAAQYDEEMVNLFHLIKKHYDDNQSNVEINLTDEEQLVLFRMAHERDITLNKMVEIIIMNVMEKEKWTEENSSEDQGW